jgi:RNA polymerase sigma factor (sigma-70 family)
MDRYGYIVEELARHDFRRLRAWSPEGRGKFSTWLVVVAQRLCQDYHRKRFGRPRPGADRNAAEESRLVRRRLYSLIGDELNPDLTRQEDAEDPEHNLRNAELLAALEAALENLGPHDRLLLRYRFDDDRTLSEITRIMRLPSVFHTFRRLRRLTDSLRAELERRGVDGPSP